MNDKKDAFLTAEFLVRCENLANAISELVVAIALVPEMSSYTNDLKNELKDFERNVLTYINDVKLNYTGE